MQINGEMFQRYHFMFVNVINVICKEVITNDLSFLHVAKQLLCISLTERTDINT